MDGEPAHAGQPPPHRLRCWDEARAPVFVSKIRTLRIKREIDEVFGRGIRRRGTLLSIAALARPDEEPRALFVTSKRVGKAVVRNRVRRRLREAYRATRSELLPCDVAFVAQPRAAEAGYASLLAEMRRLLAKTGLLARGG